MNRVWILGAPDPEMELIEKLLRECGEEVRYALDDRGERVHPGNAYRCPTPEVPEGSTVYAVECLDVLPEGWVRIDHHRPGDPGYGRPPEDFMAASSIGQVIAELAIMRRWREETVEGRVYFPSEIPIERVGWRTLRGGSHHDHDSNWEIEEIGKYTDDEGGEAFVIEMVEEGGYYHVPSIGWVLVAARGGHELGGCVDAIVIPDRLVLAAAADHCLALAYDGDCPGVDPDDLMRWRAETRAAHQGRSVDDVLADIALAREALESAPKLALMGRIDGDWDESTFHIRPAMPGRKIKLPELPYFIAHHTIIYDLRHAYTVSTVLVEPFAEGATVDAAGVGDSREVVFGARDEGAWDEGGHHTFVRRGVPELPEAASREGAAYIATVVDRDGREKVVLGGCTTPEVVRAFMEQWAPGEGLEDIYGDPERGFAGGYLSEFEEAE